MVGRITYGPHDFDSPVHYLNGCNSVDELLGSHDKMLKTFIESMNCKNPSSIFSQMQRRFDLNVDEEINFNFINYGNTEMVYLVSFGGKQKFTGLVSQSNRPPGISRKSFGNLERMFQLDDKFVVEPYAYFQDENNGIYLSEYIQDAKCLIANKENGWGVFNPIPKYHFETFSIQDASNLKSNMIALLVNYYDERSLRGLGSVQASGNDFILSQKFNCDDSEEMLNNMKMISGREYISTTFEDYLDFIREEFGKGTHYSDFSVKSGSMKINHKSVLPMTGYEIEKGIEIGHSLRLKRL